MKQFSDNTWSELPSKSRYYPSFVNIPQEYDRLSSYKVGDLVRVMPGVNYDYPFSNPVKSNIDATSGISTPIVTGTYRGVIVSAYDSIPMPGVWCCVTSVPSFEFLVTFAQNNPEWTNLAVFSTHTTVTVNNKNWIPNIRFYDVNYAPIWPELPKRAVKTSSDLKLAAGRYWELISLLPMEQKVCVNGKSKTVYIDTAISGSNSGSLA